MRSTDPRWPLFVAPLIVVAVIVADIAAGPDAVFISLLVCAPLLCGLTTSPAATRAVAVFAIACALPAFLWNDNLEKWS